MKFKELPSQNLPLDERLRIALEMSLQACDRIFDSNPNQYEWKETRDYVNRFKNTLERIDNTDIKYISDRALYLLAVSKITIKKTAQLIESYAVTFSFVGGIASAIYAWFNYLSGNASKSVIPAIVGLGLMAVSFTAPQLRKKYIKNKYGKVIEGIDVAMEDLRRNSAALSDIIHRNYDNFSVAIPRVR